MVAHGVVEHISFVSNIHDVVFCNFRRVLRARRVECDCSCLRLSAYWISQSPRLVGPDRAAWRTGSSDCATGVHEPSRVQRTGARGAAQQCASARIFAYRRLLSAASPRENGLTPTGRGMSEPPPKNTSFERPSDYAFCYFVKASRDARAQ